MWLHALPCRVRIHAGPSTPDGRPGESRHNLLGESTLPPLTYTDRGSQLLLILLYNREWFFGLIMGLVCCGLSG